MNRLQWVLALMLSMTAAALASNPQDEQVVRNAYAKLAYAVQARTVYMQAKKNPKLTPSELAEKLKDSELQIEINDMSSGALSEIGSRPYSDFVTDPSSMENVLSIIYDSETFDENGQRYTTLFANPKWSRGGQQGNEDWNTPVKEAMKLAPLGHKFSRYVSANISVRFEGKSRTYRSLWLFGSNDSDDALAVDLVSGQVVRDFALQSAYPSVLTDTRLRKESAVNDWLNSTQRVDASCKTGKQDVCCDSTLHCGIASEDLRSTKPAPNTKAAPKGGL